MSKLSHLATGHIFCFRIKNHHAIINAKINDVPILDDS